MSVFHRSLFSPTPQRVPIFGASQVENNAGGYVFKLDKWKALQRFLILGTEGGTFYVNELSHTRKNVECLDACIAEDAMQVIRVITEISQDGRSNKNDYALFAFARVVASKHCPETDELIIPFLEVVRTGTHLFQFVSLVTEMRGWGRRLKKLVGAWYTTKDRADLAYQLLKYRNREGWTHRDVLRCAHPRIDGNPDIHWAIRGDSGHPDLDHRIAAFNTLNDSSSMEEVIHAVQDHGLTHEMLPTHALASPAVWEALLDRMPMHAMVRNLARMTVNGLLDPFSAATGTVCDRLSDPFLVKRSKLHPMDILKALYTYKEGGKGRRRAANGRYMQSTPFNPVQRIEDALNTAFYASFENVEPTGKNTLIAVDVSGSMAGGYFASSGVMGVPSISPRIAAACLALTIAKREPKYAILGYSHQLVQLPITASDSLGSAIQKMSNIPMGSTDCALPWIAATQQSLDVDVCISITDNETWSGTIHPVEALKNYRKAASKPDARSVVIGMTATNFTVNDPSDPYALDIAGFDSAIPRIISDFVLGRV